MNKLILIFFISILILSCQSDKERNLITEEIDLNGGWKYLGFGKALIINDTIVNSFHTSSVGNVLESNITKENFFDYYTVDTLSNDTILLKDGVKTFKLYRSNDEFLKTVNKELENDPKYNFEVLWNTFNEQYCYFKERNIDWDEMYKKYEPQVNSRTKPLELYLVLEKMLGEINDGHISIDLPDELEEAYEKQLANTEFDESIPNGLAKKVKNRIINKYVKNVNFYNRGDFKWGMINEDIAYLQTQNMIGWANYNISDTVSTNKFWEKWWQYVNSSKNYHDDAREGTRFIMDSIIKSIGNAKACIIDLRFNGGGFDDVSVEILNHFVKKETDFCTKKVRLGQGFTEKQVMTLVPSEKTFNGKLYILTSHETASAAELLVLGSKEIPGTQIIGSTTEGVFSDILRKKLPNGWGYGLSNMIYESLSGISYEEIGIAPDIKLDYPVKSNEFYEYLYENLKDGDEAIEKVINYYRK
ncbi:hypothetical protein GTQ40_17800 [Flavobacteriaceae bacterium R38]|nr:hypothetical protein [Flavobacteriaceae bacterium R38]